MTIQGEGFCDGTRVLFGEVAVDAAEITGKELKLQVPATLEPGIVSLRVEATGKQSPPVLVRCSDTKG